MKQTRSGETGTRRHSGAVSAREDSSEQRWRVIRPAPTVLPAASRAKDLRTRVAFEVGKLAAGLSRRLGMGSGAIIGGRVAMALQPRALPYLGQGKQVVMITGTNGKTTTTQMVAEALRAAGETVSNATGANMLDGHVAALMRRPQAPYAALEVDELHLAQVTEQFEPAVIVLLNLTRDQLDRVGEIRTVEHSIRRALRQAPGAHVVANSDDPNVVSAAADHPNVTWVSGGGRWKDDALNCPRCGAFLQDVERDWQCACGLARPAADWTVDATGLIGPDGEHRDLSLRLPGQVNRVNAAFALSAALVLGGEAGAVLDRISGIEQANGRYGAVSLAGRTVRLLLAKNPASWLEMLDLVATHRRPLLLVLNSREADGHDVSWLWDIEFESLQDRAVTVSGDRALDLAVRLRYAGVRCEVASSVPAALAAMPQETPDVIANYTAFRDLFAKGVRP